MDYMTWYDYKYQNINLSFNFLGLNTKFILINKKTFLSLYIKGNIIPVKLKVDGVEKIDTSSLYVGKNTCMDGNYKIIIENDE